MQKVLTTSLVALLRSGGVALGAAGMLVYTSPPLAGLSLLVFPAVFLLGSSQGRAIRAEQKAVQQSLAEASAMAQRSLAAVRTLRALGAEDRQRELYEESIDAVRDHGIQVGVRQAYLDSAVQFASNASMLAVLAYGGQIVAAGSLSPGELSSFVVYSMWLGFASSQLSTAFAEYARAAGASQRLLELMTREPRMRDGADDTLIRGKAPRALSVEFDHVSFRYKVPEKKADGDDTEGNRQGQPEMGSHVSDFSLTISPGERVGIMGQSGCGKSTLLRLMSRLYDVDTGAVRVGGVDVRQVSSEVLRGPVVAYVPQEPLLLSGSLRDNVILGVLSAAKRCHVSPPSDDETVRALQRAGLGGLLERLPGGLDTPVGEGGLRLSGGEKQRCVLARLMLCDPPVILLDEFTSALDTTTEAAVAASLREFLEGRTVIAVAHKRRSLEIIGVKRILRLGLGCKILASSWRGEQDPLGAAAAA